MHRPLIGISAEMVVVERYWGTQPHQAVPDAYVTAVRAAGGVPVVLPVGDPDLAEEVLARLDGLVLTGGNDVDPSLYGQTRIDAGTGGEIDPARDRFEIALINAAIDGGVAALCVCRGQQVLNVARGGTLIQHLDRHDTTPADRRTSHELTVDGASRFARRFAGLRRANSFHHQAVDRPGTGVRVAAIAADGVAEAIELDGFGHVVSVQWHPELLIDDDEHLGLFEWLVAEARGRRDQ